MLSRGAYPRPEAAVVAAFAASLVLAGGCRISELDLDGLPCPCASTAWQCDEPTSTCVPAEPGPFSLTVTRPWSVLPQTRSGTLTVELSTASRQSITVQFRDLPAGITTAPGLLTLSPAAPTAELTIIASTGAALGAVTLELEGTGPAGDRVVEPVRIEIGGHPGTLDPTFGDQGIATNPPGLPDGVTFPVMALRPDDRIVIAGLSGLECFVAQYTAEGQLDPDFELTRIHPGSAQSPCAANGISLQPDGKVVVVGRSGNPAMPVVLRYLAGGGADPSFGTAGVALVDTPAYLQSVAVRGDGRIVAVGNTIDGAGGSNIVLFRFLADGTPDPQFGSGGRIAPALSQGSDSATAMQLLGDGRFIVAGERATSPPRALLARFLASGALDPSFGGGGLVVGEPGTALSTLLDRRDGRLVVGGLYTDGGLFTSPTGGFVTGYDTAGQLDPSFGAGGVTVLGSLQPPSTDVRGVVVTPLGPLIVADSSLLMALDASGHFDPELGYVASPISPISSLAIQRTGNLVVMATDFVAKRVFLMRLWP